MKDYPPPKKKKKKKKKKRFWIIICTTIWVCYHYYGIFFAHLLILQYPDHHQNLISSSLYYSGPAHKISSQSVHNFLSNVVHRQTDRQTDRQTNQRYQKHNLLCQGGKPKEVTIMCNNQLYKTNSWYVCLFICLTVTWWVKRYPYKAVLSPHGWYREYVPT